jgi:hypothetical protein
MTEQEIRDCFFDLEIHQKSIDSLIDHLHDLITQGKISDAKIVADQIRQIEMG